jgi:hypothetical protein
MTMSQGLCVTVDLSKIGIIIFKMLTKIKALKGAEGGRYVLVNGMTFVGLNLQSWFSCLNVLDKDGGLVE